MVCSLHVFSPAFLFTNIMIADILEAWVFHLQLMYEPFILQIVLVWVKEFIN